MRLGQRTVSYQAYISFGFPFINPPLVNPMRDALIQSLVYGLARKARRPNYRTAVHFLP